MERKVSEDETICLTQHSNYTESQLSKIPKKSIKTRHYQTVNKTTASRMGSQQRWLVGNTYKRKATQLV